MIRVGPDIRYLARRRRIIRHIWQGMPDNPAGYPTSGPTLVIIQVCNCDLAVQEVASASSSLGTRILRPETACLMVSEDGSLSAEMSSAVSSFGSYWLPVFR